MHLGRYTFRTFLFVFCLAGYIWIYLNFIPEQHQEEYSVCLFKQVTHVPCPSCGTTRSVESILHGKYSDALYWNPLGFLMLLALLLTPFWIVFDGFSKKNSMEMFYKKAEVFLQQKKYAIPGITLVLMNWIWNISKGL